MKNNFIFVNSPEKKSAVQAREALTGAQVNGEQLRINFAKESGRLGTTFSLRNDLLILHSKPSLMDDHNKSINLHCYFELHGIICFHGSF